MADSQHTPTLPENRTDLEALIEAAIARLDAFDGDPDLEVTAEDDEDGHDAEKWYDSWVSPPVDCSPLRFQVRS